jgi:hypothetical protein
MAKGEKFFKNARDWGDEGKTQTGRRKKIGAHVIAL